MKYELAKQLKDAGWPQGELEGKPDAAPTWPTLSELVEACGDDLHSLRRGRWMGKGDWIASKDRFVQDCGHSEPEMPVGVGDTPESAVAGLWLALNKK